VEKMEGMKNQKIAAAETNNSGTSNDRVS